RARARRSSGGVRGRGGRQDGRDDGSSGCCVRDPRRRRRAVGRARRRAARARRSYDRPDREAEVDPVHRRPAEDALGQDHAPAAQERERGRRARRHPHARRSRRRGEHQGPVPLAERCRRGMSSAPDNWNWRTGPLDPGPAAVVDIDGVLSDAASRQHYLDAPRQDWRAFFDACGEDPVIEEMRVLLDLLDPALRIGRLPARPGGVHAVTEGWLRRYGIRWDGLIMRGRVDDMGAREFKEMSVAELRAYGMDLRIAFEDDRRNVEMFRRAGVPCVYFHSGYYD